MKNDGFQDPIILPKLSPGFEIDSCSDGLQMILEHHHLGKFLRDGVLNQHLDPVKSGNVLSVGPRGGGQGFTPPHRVVNSDAIPLGTIGSPERSYVNMHLKRTQLVRRMGGTVKGGSTMRAAVAREIHWRGDTLSQLYPPQYSTL